MTAPLLFSVVTPCLNSRAHIECTIRSVLDRAYRALDHIVADGGSTDGSLEYGGDGVVCDYIPHLGYLTMDWEGGSFSVLSRPLRLNERRMGNPAMRGKLPTCCAELHLQVMRGISISPFAVCGWRGFACIF